MHVPLFLLSLLGAACATIDAPSSRGFATPRARGEANGPPPAPSAAATTPASATRGAASQEPAAAKGSWFERAFATIAADHGAFYDQGSLLGLGAGIGLAALSANTQLDRDIYEDVLPEWRTKRADSFRDSVLWLGEGTVMLPTFGAAALLAPMLGSDDVGTWGERSLRAALVGAPPMLALQRLTGAGRPDDPANRNSSEWEPFEFSNGVSGHAFMGAIPFLTAARMQDDPWLDGLLYIASATVPAARLQGSRHYFSQVVLGWWIAFLATGAVDDAAASDTTPGMSFVPILGADEVGIVVVHRF